MREPKSRRTPERIAVAWAPFLVGALVASFGGSAVLAIANLVLGAAVAVALASSGRTTGRLLRLVPRAATIVLIANGAVLVTLFALDRL